MHYEPCVRDASETKLIRLVYLFLYSSPEQPLNSLIQRYVFFRAIKPTVHRKRRQIIRKLGTNGTSLDKKVSAFLTLFDTLSSLRTESSSLIRRIIMLSMDFHYSRPFLAI